jgi:hypothetical protein
MLKERYSVENGVPIDESFLKSFERRSQARVQIFDYRQQIPESKVIYKAATPDLWIEGVLGENHLIVTFMTATKKKAYETFAKFLENQ